MKKRNVMLLFVVMLLSTVFVSAQPPYIGLSNTDIAKTIAMSRQANESIGVFDPNKINPGQELTFLFQDGQQKMITVEVGDNQWKILRDKLSQMIEKHGPLVNYDTPTPIVKTDIPPSANKISGINWWKWFLIGLMIVSFIIAFVRWIVSVSSKNTDPVTSGPAIREGGVTDEQARVYASEVAARQFNVPNLQVTNVTRGRISGNNVAVFYAGQATPQRRTFSNVVGYRGTVTIKKNEQFVYFLQGCGNDVRVGNYFTGGDIQFIPETVIHQQSVETSRVTQEVREAEAEVLGTVKVIKTDPEKEFDLIKQILDKVKDKDQADIKITTQSGVSVCLNFSKIVPKSGATDEKQNN